MDMQMQYMGEQRNERAAVDGLGAGASGEAGVQPARVQARIGPSAQSPCAERSHPSCSLGRRTCRKSRNLIPLTHTFVLTPTAPAETSAPRLRSHFHLPHLRTSPARKLPAPRLRTASGAPQWPYNRPHRHPTPRRTCPCTTRAQSRRSAGTSR